MRHAPIAFAEQLAEGERAAERWDVIFCSDMLDLATFLGLAGPAVRTLPTVAYFHENQLTYPVQHAEPRDCHFAFTNLTTAAAATEVWFNSAWHRDAFLGALRDFLPRMPDHQPLDAIDRIAANSAIRPPGIEAFAPRPARAPGPLHILWAARWEYDKGPETFFQAVHRLDRAGVDFRLSVIGEQFRHVPEVFAQARESLSRHVDRWGYQAGRDEYAAALAEADVFVSTARHEFFGISAVEAIAAGALPVLPNRLAYPEVLAQIAPGSPEELLYDGTVEGLAKRLSELAALVDGPGPWHGRAPLAQAAQERFGWSRVAPRLDDALAAAAERP
jgi:glycosyltransferase involved in cell wall biosynthesis